MKVSDCPYAVGTPQHLSWIQSVYIPTVKSERMEQDRTKYGAASIGGKLILGHEEDWARLQLATANRVAQKIATSFRSVSFELTIEKWEEFKQVCFGPGGREVSSAGYTRAAPVRRTPPIPPRRQRECPRHGGPADRCRVCMRGR